MKFLLDANIPYSAKEIFARAYTVVHVRDVALAHAADEVIIRWAKRHKAALITRDLDFANILNFPPREYFGIVVLKLPYFYHARAIERVLGDFLSKVDMRTVPRATIIVEEGRIRIKK